MNRLGRVGLSAAVVSLLATGTAGAATLHGTVVAPPAVHGTTAVVPLLATGGRAVKVVVPRSAIRTSNGRIAAGSLRFGDRVTVTGAHGATKRPRAARLRVTRRGRTASFTTIARRRARTIAQVKAAIDEVAALPATSKQVAGTPGADPAVVRQRLHDVRTDVNYSIADLRAQAGALETVVAGASRVARGSGAYLTSLKANAGDARKAADALDVAVGALDQTINDVGGASDPALPISSTSAVTDLLHQVLDLLRGLPGANPTG